MQQVPLQHGWPKFPHDPVNTHGGWHIPVPTLHIPKKHTLVGQHG
jgi:hypothetical protein